MKLCPYLFLCAVLLMLNPHISGADGTYTAKKGDSLYKIAKKFKVAPEDIQEVNGISAGQIRPGSRLTIPSNKHDAKRHARRHSLNSSHSGAVLTCALGEHRDPVNREKRYHTVKKGETLHSIAVKYSTGVGRLRDLNGLNETEGLRPGQRLLIREMVPRVYVVKKGDTITKIAKRISMDPDDLREVNHLDSDKLKPGQRLLLDEPGSEHETANRYSASLSEEKVHEEIKTLSKSPDLMSLTMKERLILFAKKMLNIPYKFGGSGFFGIDCSGYVQKVFGFLNIPLPRTAREQFDFGESIIKEELSIGDLVFFRTYASFPSHVGIYLGNNLFIHASSRDRKVTIDSLETPYYSARFIGGRRLI